MSLTARPAAMVRGVSESAAGGSHSAGDVDSKSDPATQELDRALTEHNPAPPQPACCCVDPKDLQRGAFYSEWYHKYIYRTETLVKRTNVALRQKVDIAVEQRDPKAVLIAITASIEHPLPLNTVLRNMSSILAAQPGPFTSRGIASPAMELELSAETHLAIQRYSNHMPLCTPSYTIGIPSPTLSVRIGDVGYVHEKTGQFVRLVNPFDMEHTALGAMKSAQGLDQNLLRVCRHPEQRWYPGHYASADVARLEFI